MNSATDVYAVGEKGVFVHFDGTQWSSIDAGVSAPLRSLWGDGTGAVYVAGWKGTVLRWDGAAFADVPLPAGLARDAGFSPNYIIGSKPSDLWILAGNRDALRFNGNGWISHPFVTKPGDAVTAIWPVGDGFAYALVRRGSAAFVDRFDGFRTVSIPVPTTSRSISGLGNEIVVLTGSALLRYRHDPADVFP